MGTFLKVVGGVVATAAVATTAYIGYKHFSNGGSMPSIPVPTPPAS